MPHPYLVPSTGANQRASGGSELETYFSEHFGVDKEVLDQYGAFDISLLRDLPLFVDPFLLFYSEKPEYQQLHANVIRYLRNLRELTRHELSDATIDHLFCFHEVRQNWFGFSFMGNAGHGLGRAFAIALNRNLRHLFPDFGSETITRGTHLEKLTLVKSGIGRDMVSDFTTNLIKGYLLEFTQAFATEHLDSSKVERHSVTRAVFDYERGYWTHASYWLPTIGSEFVLLTPRDILTKDETWISRPDFLADLRTVPEAMLNDLLRQRLEEFLIEAFADIPQNRTPSIKDFNRVIDRFIETSPEVLDYYIKSKEDSGADAVRSSMERVDASDKLYVTQLRPLIGFLRDSDFYSLRPDSATEARQRLEYLKHVIEDRGGWRLFYLDHKPIGQEENLKICYSLAWFGAYSDLSREVNDGLGAADFKASQGSMDKSIVEFKLASNSGLRKNLQRQVPAYQKASEARTGLTAIQCYDEQEIKKVKDLLAELGLANDPDIYLIDASPKTSASRLG